jgi:hypothetical protein
VRPAEHGIVQSVRQRLLNRSRESGEDYNLLLTRYAIERLLYRLTQSEHANDFILKGAMLFTVWTGAMHRPTRDLDLLGFGEPSEDRLIGVFRNVCEQTVDDDGMAFDGNTITAAPIREEQAYAGIRLRIAAKLGNARLNLQIDVGFGNVVTPEARTETYPTLLDQPAPELRLYSPESVVAEAGSDGVARHGEQPDAGLLRHMGTAPAIRAERPGARSGDSGDVRATGHQDSVERSAGSHR